MKGTKKRKREGFGKFSKFILSITIPMVAIQAIYLVYYIVSRDMFELFANFELVTYMAESVLMSLLLSVGGCLLMDIMEKSEIS